MRNAGHVTRGGASDVLSCQQVIASPIRNLSREWRATETQSVLVSASAVLVGQKLPLLGDLSPSLRT